MGCELDQSESGQGQVGGCREHNITIKDTIKCGEFLDNQKICLIAKWTALWIWMLSTVIENCL